MESLQNLEYLISDLVDLVWYSKIFAIAIGVAFLIVFGGLVIINANLHEAKEEIKELKDLIKGGNGNGTNDECGHESDIGRS